MSFDPFFSSGKSESPEVLSAVAKLHELPKKERVRRYAELRESIFRAKPVSRVDYVWFTQQQQINRAKLKIKQV